MILVVCPNLAVDVTLEVASLRVGDVHRAQRSQRHAGGKGINLARAATTLEETTLVVGFAGGRRGGELRALVEEENIESNLIDISGESRTCTILLEPSGAATVVNEVGASFGAHEADERTKKLLETVQSLLDGADAVALMGSLQPGLPETLYAELVRLTRAAGKFCLVDASNAPLREALSAGPHWVKPNRAEAEEISSRQLDTESACADAVRELRRAGADIALVSRGADGVVFSDGETVARCMSSPPVDMRYANPTGAGDALAAGLLVGHVRGLSVEDSVRFGVASATASLAQGYGRFRAKDFRLDAVRIERLD